MWLVLYIGCPGVISLHLPTCLNMPLRVLTCSQFITHPQPESNESASAAEPEMTCHSEHTGGVSLFLNYCCACDAVCALETSSYGGVCFAGASGDAALQPWETIHQHPEAATAPEKVRTVSSMIYCLA